MLAVTLLMHGKCYSRANLYPAISSEMLSYKTNSNQVGDQTDLMRGALYRQQQKYPTSYQVLNQLALTGKLCFRL